jgi:hypothetical protein
MHHSCHSVDIALVRDSAHQSAFLESQLLASTFRAIFARDNSKVVLTKAFPNV